MDAKTENGYNCMLSGSKIIGLSAMKLIADKTLLETIKAEHAMAIQPTKKNT